MSQRPVDLSPKSMVTSHDIEHPHAIGRRVKAGLTLVGAAAAGVFARILTSPAAIADPAELPVFPEITSAETGAESIGIPPLFVGQAFDANAT